MLFEMYENIISTHINNYLGIFMRDKWQLNEEQLQELLLVTNVIIGAPITEESKDEASTCFEPQRAEDCAHKAGRTRCACSCHTAA
jgi:hypothetical protein